MAPNNTGIFHQNTNFRRGILAIIGCLLVDFSIGELNLLGFLYPYFIAYFRQFDPDITLKDMKIIPMCWMLIQIISCPLGIYTYMLLDFRKTFALFITTFSQIQIISSYITNFYAFAILYGLSGGLSQGALMILPIYCGWRYFSEAAKPHVSGIVLSAYAICPVFTSVFALYIINPNNQKQEEVLHNGETIWVFGAEVAMNVPYFLRWFGVFSFVMGMLGVALILDPIREIKSDSLQTELKDKVDSYDENEKDNSFEYVNTGRVNIKTQSFKEGMRNFQIPVFRKVMVTMIFSYLYPHLMNFGFKSIGQKYLNDDRFVTWCGSISALINGLCRYAAGHYVTNFGYSVFLKTIQAITCVNALTFVWFSNYHWTYLIAVCMFIITYGGQLGSFPLISDKLFKEKGALAYSMLQIGFELSNIIGLMIYSTQIDYTGWFWQLIIIAGLSQIPQVWVKEIDNAIIRKQINVNEI